MSNGYVFLSKKTLNKLHSLFGYKGLLYYFGIIEELSNTSIIEKKYFNKLSRKLKISKKKLMNFVTCCTKIFEHDNFSILSENNNYVWCDFILKNKFEINKKRKGRKIYSTKDSIDLTNASNVNLTEKQYKKLQAIYGKEFIDRAILILNVWLSKKSKEAKKYIGKNNYAHFRKDSWLIKATIDSL